MDDLTLPQQPAPLPTDPETISLDTAGPQVNPRKKVWKEFLSKIASCKTYRRKLTPLWQTNIDYRRAKPFATNSDDDRIAVPMDWTLTKSKQVALFSQVPQVHVNHSPQTVAAGPGLYAFEQKLNDTLISAGIEAVMEECLADVINASGIGAVMCARESIVEYVEVPTLDPKTLDPQTAQFIAQNKTMPDGSPVPTETVPRPSDSRYTVLRISPADLLWPVGFTGSDFDNAPWIGRSGRMSWTEAQNRFNLQDDEKDDLVSKDDRKPQDRIVNDADREADSDDALVSFDEIFYKDFQYEKGTKTYDTIHHMIFLNGKEEAVLDEAWKGQREEPSQDPNAKPALIGALKFPIRILTLTYISDETIPPSDTAIGRAQVNEINLGRTQMILQRKHSIPVRWFNPDRVPYEVQQSLMRGTWQNMIPIQGDGARSIGEIARASMPQEDFTFYQTAKSDLYDTWQIGPNQQGNFGRGRQSASEVNVVQQNTDSRTARERAKVTKFVCSVAEVIGGLLCLFESPKAFGEGFSPLLSKTLCYSILADSTVLLDSNQRRERIQEWINFAAKSGYANIEYALKEYASLSSLDPNVAVQKPEPKNPDPPTISLRMTGAEDLSNPLFLAFLLEAGLGPKPETIEQAKKMLESSVALPAPPAPSPGPPGPPPPNGPQGGPLPVPSPPPVGGAHPEWSETSKINKRSDDGE